MTSWTLIVGWTLVHFVWQGAVIGLIAAIALRWLRGATAQARYVTACGALVLAMMAPLVTLPSLATLGSGAAAAADVGVPPGRANAPLDSAPAAAVASVSHDAGGSARAPSVDGDRLATVLPIFVGFWIVGVLVLTGRLAVGWWRVRLLHVEALATPASRWLEAAAGIAARLRLPRPIHVIDSHDVDTPTVIGWLRPVVLLPVAALANLSPGQVQAILAHELAHVRRHDFVVNVLQTIAETVLFYHPVVWWLSARIRVEREHCCDDIAVEVCGDPVGYAEALTELASSVISVPLAVAATGGSLLPRVRRLLQLPVDAGTRRPKAPMVVAATVVLVAIVGLRFMVVAEGAPSAPADDRAGVGPGDVNQLVGFNLFPPRPHYPTDDPLGARSWDVRVTFPGGEMPFIGFTARTIIRYAFELDGGAPVMDGPAWLDRESLSLHVTTPATAPDDSDLRLALRTGLQRQFGLTLNHAIRDFPVYGLVIADADGRLGPSLHPSTVECLEGRRPRPPVASKQLIARGQNATLCGIDDSFFGPTAYRVTMAEFARSLRRFPMGGEYNDREVIDQTGLTGDFDFTLRVGPLPLAAIATAHPELGVGLLPFGIHTLPQALESQLGLRLEPTEAPREVAVIATAHRPAFAPSPASN